MSTTQEDSNYPAYLPFGTFRTAIQSLRSHGLPPKLDKTAWDSRSGTDQGLIIGAFKFLGLIDELDMTQPSLRALVDAAENTPGEKEALKAILMTTYAGVFQLDLKTATPLQIKEAFSAYGNVKGSTKDRAVRFFLKAATHCGIPMSSRLTIKLRERTSVGSTENEDSSEGESVSNGGGTPKPRKKRRAYIPPPPAPPVLPATPGSAVKVVTFLASGGGMLTLSGTFNAFELEGRERKLVYDIIDLMKVYEQKPETPAV